MAAALCLADIAHNVKGFHVTQEEKDPKTLDDV
jgi:hypothetical protein